MYFLLLLKKVADILYSLKQLSIHFLTNKLCKLLLLLQMPALHFILIFKILIEHVERKKAVKKQEEKLKH